MPIERNYDQFIMTVLANIQKESIFSQYPCGVYMVYGSYVIQEQNTHSDMDILYIHKEEDNKPFRMQFYYQQLPITMYFVSKTDFQEDSNGKYGGYFVGKALNPNIIVSDKTEDRIFVLKCCGIFIGKFAAYIASCQNRNENNSQHLTKQVLLAYLKICPPYIAYLVRYNVAQHCDLIWNWITENIKESLLISNSIKSTGSHNYQYTVQLSREEYERCLVEYAANFWAFGAVSHNNIHFYHFYKDKNNDYIIKNHYQGIAITIKKKLEEQ